jgi:hypothetical protein
MLSALTITSPLAFAGMHVPASRQAIKMTVAESPEPLGSSDFAYGTPTRPPMRAAVCARWACTRVVSHMFSRA